MNDGTDERGPDGDAAEVAEIEAMLRGLDADDLGPPSPPSDLWASIERTIATSTSAVERRLSSRTWLMAAAAVLIVVAVGTTLAIMLDRDEEALVSTAVLVHDPAAFDPRGAESAATARLVERDGHFEIELTDADLPTLAGDDLELWLIEPDADGNPLDVQPVAVIDVAGSGTYRIPDGLDPESHSVVDISIEPRDGQAAHSGQSILRGSFDPS